MRAIGLVCGKCLVVVAIAAGCSTDPTGEVGAIDKAPNDLAAARPNAGFATLEGSAVLTPIDRSGVLARIEFLDDGATLTVTGSATGLDPSETYLTLIYDNGSLPGGPDACMPTVFDFMDPDFLLGTMLVGSWVVDAEGRGTLSAVNTNFGADYVPLTRFRSTSVRRVTGPPPMPGGPPATELVACGHVATQPRG